MGDVNRPTTQNREASRPPRRSRFGYDSRWWGRLDRAEAARDDYWDVSRRSLPSLVFIAPILLAYESWVVWGSRAGGPSPRGAADAWVADALRAVGLDDVWWPPALLVLALAGGHILSGRRGTFPVGHLAGMVVESVALALALIGLGRAIDLGFNHLDRLPALWNPGDVPPPAAPLMEYLGAGLYEEALFRLALFAAAERALVGVRAPRLLAAVLAMTGSGLAFALAHHLGGPGEGFTWFAFAFRWSAGVTFAWIYHERGFGVAVGTHTAYDLFVGGLGWQM